MIKIKKILPIIIALVIVGGGAFYGGMKYQQNKIPSRGNLQGLPSGQDQQFRSRNGNTSDFLGGEVLSKDNQSITIKTQNGNSQIVFFSASTTVSKMADGSIDDVTVGKQIMVTGGKNSDGSYNAKTIQIR
jgi:hypothetical protein